MSHCRWSCLFYLCVSSLTCFGQGQIVALSGPRLPTIEAADDLNFEQMAIKWSERISDQVSAAGETIDLWLARQRFTDKRNNSHLNISQLVNWTEAGRITPSTDFGFNLALPNLERRWQVRFSSYDEDQEARDLNQRTVRTAPHPKNPGAAISLLKTLGKVRASFQPRIQLSNPLQVAYVARFERPMAKENISLEPRIELFADSNKGTGEFASLRMNLEHPRNTPWSYSFESDEEYQQHLNTFQVNHALSANYTLRELETLGASFVLSSTNHPFHLDSMTVAVSDNHRIFNNLLSLSFTPYLGFAKSTSFHGHPGLSLTAEVVF